MRAVLRFISIIPLVVFLITPPQSGVSASGACTPVPSGLVSWWSGNGDAHDVWGGNSGFAHDGVAYTKGKVDLAMTLDGVDDGIAVTDAENLRLSESLSIEAWIYVSSRPLYLGMVFFRGDDRQYYDPYYLAITPSGELRFHIEASPNAIHELLAPISLGQWTHVAATLDGTTGAMRLYINGGLANEIVTTIRPLPTLYPAYNAGIGIGNLNWYPPYPLYTRPFHGKIDELSVYRRALSTEEIERIVAADSFGKCRISSAFLPMIMGAANE